LFVFCFPPRDPAGQPLFLFLFVFPPFSLFFSEEKKRKEEKNPFFKLSFLFRDRVLRARALAFEGSFFPLNSGDDEEKKEKKGEEGEGERLTPLARSPATPKFRSTPNARIKRKSTAKHRKKKKLKKGGKGNIKKKKARSYPPEK